MSCIGMEINICYFCHLHEDYIKILKGDYVDLYLCLCLWWSCEQQFPVQFDGMHIILQAGHGKFQVIYHHIVSMVQPIDAGYASGFFNQKD